MIIIILGAGQVGTTAAENLSREKSNEVTVVDVDPDRLRELQDRLDIQTVQGHAAYPDVLEKAGARDADMIIALTNSDETNMVACQVAYTFFHTHIKIARIRAAEYTTFAKKMFTHDSLAVDVIISPEQLVTEHIEQLIHYPGALLVLDFAEGKVRLVSVRAHKEGLLVGQKLKTLKEHIPDVETRVAAIYRRDQSIPVEGDTIIHEGDEVFFIAARKNIRVVMSELRKLEEPVRRVVIAGGGNIGFRLAKALEETNQVKLIERDRNRARIISEKLNRTIVLHGDATNEEKMREENIDAADVFCAVTDREEANILSAMLARRMGANKVMALINRPVFADIVERGSIDIAISPQQITIGSLLADIRRGDVTRVHALRRGNAEAMEVVAHGDMRTSRVVGRTIEELPLPAGTTISAIVRGNDVVMAHHDTVIESDDHVILFITEREHVSKVERLFETDVTFV
ncbi:MAG: Trk system potassium transporter TrkA [Gammaproteobacteria bacterium]